MAAWDARPPAATKGGAEEARRLVREGEAHWARRAEVVELRAAIRSWEGAIRADALDVATHLRLARACHLLADAFLAPDDGQKPGRDYLLALERGLTHAERALLADPDFRAALEAGAPVVTAIEKVGIAGVPALFWYGATLRLWTGAWRVTHPPFEEHMDMNRRHRAALERVIALDAGYLHAGAHRELARRIDEVDLHPKGRSEHADAALRLAPEHLGARLAWVEASGLPNDAESRRRELNLIVAAPDDLVPDAIVEARLAKQRAARMLERGW